MLPGDSGDPVLSVWLSPEGTYAFVEFHTVESANNGLGLNGLMLLTSALRISRPNNYQPTVGINIDGIMAMANSGGCGADAAATVPSTGMVPQPSSGPMLTAMSQLHSFTNTIAPPAPPAPVLTSTVLACANMLTNDELNDDEEREGLKEDVADECKKFGTVKSMKVPVSGNDGCMVYIQFSTVLEAGVALKSLSGRKFDGRTVEVISIPEPQFDTLVDGK